MEKYINPLADSSCSFDFVESSSTPSRNLSCSFLMSGGFYCISVPIGSSSFIWYWEGGLWQSGVSWTAVSPGAGYEFKGWFTMESDRTVVGDHPQDISDCNTLVTTDLTLSYDSHDSLLKCWVTNHASLNNPRSAVAVAKWYLPTDPSITFEANGVDESGIDTGWVEPEHKHSITRRCKSGEPLLLPAARRWPLGSWQFAGWYTRQYGGACVGNAGDYYTPTEDITLYAHWHQVSQHDITIKEEPGWVKSAKYTYVDYGEDYIRPTEDSPGAIGKLSWKIVLKDEPKTYFSSIHFSVWGKYIEAEFPEEHYIGIYPGPTLPWGDLAGDKPPQVLEGEFEVPFRWDSGNSETGEVCLTSFLPAYAFVFRQSRALLYDGTVYGSQPLVCSSSGSALLFGHKAYTASEAAKPTA